MREGRAGPLTTMIAAVPAGAATLIAFTSVLLAATGAGAVWFSIPLPIGGLWHLFVALAIGAALLPRTTFLPYIRRLPRFAVTILLVVAVMDAVNYYAMLDREMIRSSLPFPLSIPLVGLLVWCRFRLRPGPAEPKPRPSLLPRLAGLSTGAVLLTLTLLLTFGSTDYRRPADCAIVLGAGVRADGTPSLALSDRVNEGIRLFTDGLVDRLVMTGGTGSNGWSEPEVMKRIAIEAGVPEEAILTDPTGVDTRRSAEGCKRLMNAAGLEFALIVSHYYHLARCRMAFALAGIRCRTVPATMTRRLAREPYYVLRECAGFVAYLFPRNRSGRGRSP